MELANREAAPTATLIEMLGDSSLYARYGACQALIMLKRRAAPAIPALRSTLRAEDLWLRIKSAEALASIGEPAMETVPSLLEMLASGPSESDPRGMQQRYLCFSLFNSRDGIMFADGIRLSGLEILAKHKIGEGVPWCTVLIDLNRWGARNRVKRCLESLRLFGGAAKSEIPQLRELEKELAAKNWKPEEIENLGLLTMIEEIEEDKNPPALRSLNLSGVHEGEPKR